MWAGVRVICSFIDDIYSVAEMLSRQDDVTVITVKDYNTPAETERLSQLSYDRGDPCIFFAGKENDARRDTASYSSDGFLGQP